VLEPKRFERRRPGADRSDGPSAPGTVVRLRIVLLDVTPTVWRRLEVPVHWTLRQLHAALRCAMGWSNGGGHRFLVNGGVPYGNTAEQATARDSRWISLADVVALSSKTFRYEFTSGRTWKHEVTVEWLAEIAAGNSGARCLEGEHAWPPDGEGSRSLWVDRVDFIAADDVEPAVFDLEAINRALAQLG